MFTTSRCLGGGYEKGLRRLRVLLDLGICAIVDLSLV